MSTVLVPPGTRITNHFNKETFIFTHPYDSQVSSRMDVVLDEGGSGGGNAVEHIHPQTDEAFEVQHGRLAVFIEGTKHIVEAGGSIVVPKGARHFFRNDYVGETRITVTFANAQQHQRFFLNLALWTRDRPEYFTPEGEVRFLAIVLLLHAFHGHLYLAGIPVWLQKFIFAMATPIARFQGYRLAIRPARPGVRSPDWQVIP